ncbi:hypothetical protein [Oceanobacillus manasiensis]|uniref:hypothetical protein n=1 Tax=Oceanobacillus manasiensis TaxID=586413 RepID=UPI0005A95246|nr:hypothetical protein [Oceanobacillus manasiensis]
MSEERFDRLEQMLDKQNERFDQIEKTLSQLITTVVSILEEQTVMKQESKEQHTEVMDKLKTIEADQGKSRS